jgi:hypothetical protein
MDVADPFRAFWALDRDGDGCFVGVFCTLPFGFLLALKEVDF